MTKDENFISLPAFRHAKIAELTSVIKPIIVEYLGDGSAARTPRILSCVIAKKLGLNHQLASIDAIAASLDDVFGGKPPSIQVIHRCAYRLAANEDLIRQGIAVPYNPMTVPEYWAISEIVGFERVKKEKEWRLKIAYRILTGRLAGRRFIDTVKPHVAQVIYGVCTGYPRKCPYTTPRQLMFMKCALQISLHESRYTCEHIGISKTLRSANVKLTRSRFRNISTCPFGSALDCVNCPVGMNECDRSVHGIKTNLIRKARGSYTGTTS